MGFHGSRFKAFQQQRRRCCLLAITVAGVYAAAVLLNGTGSRGGLARTTGAVRLWRPLPGFCRHVPPVWDEGGTSTSHGPAAPPAPEINASAHVVHAGVLLALESVLRAAQAPHDCARVIWSSSGGAGAGACLASPVITLQARVNVSAVVAAAAGGLPPGSSAGRGVVVVGGGRRYTPPAYACVLFLRRSGCRLPVEVWAPPHEPIPAAAATELKAAGGVAVRSLGDALPGLPAAHAAMRRHRFLAKQLALLASSFSEVLFLDADNLPLRDPTYLFDHPAYASTGLLMWPDFWRSEVKPAAWAALGVPPAQRPPGSHESGQGVLDRRRAYQPLLLAIYFNLLGDDVFYAMFSNNGPGDKETLPLAWLALGRGVYGLVPHPVIAVGRRNPDGGFSGAAMLQHGLEGSPLFLHAHLPKVDVPARGPPPPGAPRSWAQLSAEVAVLPPGVGRGNATTHVVLDAVAGFDVEAAVQRLRLRLRCSPAWVQCCL